jgi:DNA modification methylase
MITYLTGHCIDVLRSLPEKSVHCVVTSPPYWALRDYGIQPSTWPDGWVGCLGLEPTPQLFVAHLVDVFAEVHRVLRDDGTCWINLGDSYTSGGRAKHGSLSEKQATNAKSRDVMRPDNPPGMKPKDLIGVPWMMAFALRDWGWYLRDEIIWHKPTPMTESQNDRCTKCHEKLFMLTKSPRYFFDGIAIQEPAQGRAPGNKGPAKFRNDQSSAHHQTKRNLHKVEATLTRNKRNVWTIPVARYKGAHFATFPPKLVRPCILAGTSEHGCCRTCGAPYTRIVEKGRVPTRSGKTSKVNGVSGLLADNPHEQQRGLVIGNRDPLRHVTVRKTIGWKPTCSCEPSAELARAVVLDPFGGSGTTAEVATKLGVDCILIDINPAYVQQQKARNAQGSLL